MEIWQYLLLLFEFEQLKMIPKEFHFHIFNFEFLFLEKFP
jgi:hypothetical protein